MFWSEAMEWLVSKHLENIDIDIRIFVFTF